MALFWGAVLSKELSSKGAINFISPRSVEYRHRKIKWTIQLNLSEMLHFIPPRSDRVHFDSENKSTLESWTDDDHVQAILRNLESCG